MAFVAVKCNQCGANLEMTIRGPRAFAPTARRLLWSIRRRRGRSLTVTGRLAVRAAMTPRTPIAAARPFSG